MATAEKIATVAALREKLQRAQVMILTDYRGLKVAELQQLRTQLRPTGADYMVAKNTLLRLAAGERGETLSSLLQGPTAIALCYDDLAASAKVLNDFARTSRAFTIKGGILGDRLLAPSAVAELATVPPRQQLLAQVVGGIQAPMANVLGVLQAGVSTLLLLIQARADQLQGEGGTPPAPAPA
jgi:large subunit ribosomal protein L10